MAKIKYKLKFPDQISDVQIELFCYRYDHKLEKGGLGAAGHLTKAIQMLWPEQLPNGRKGFVFSKWTHRRIKAFCEPTFRPDDMDYQAWWGSSSAGKSCDAAIIMLVDWLSAPDCTSTRVCSTTREMLGQRIWSEIVKFYMMRDKDFPGRYYKSKMRISLGDNDLKNCIRGIAVLQGSAEAAKNNIIGEHNERNRIIVDEMQDSHMQTCVEAIPNLSSGCKDFKFLGLGNPESHLDPLGQFSEPIKGWNSVNVETEIWETKRGKTLHFDGLDSPGIDDPNKYWFLLTQKDIDETRNTLGEDSPHFWTMRRGFVPPEGLVQTVMTETFMIKNCMGDIPEWDGDFTEVAGVDPAYSTGGNKCVMHRARIGKFMNGLMGIGFYPEPIIIKMRASAEETMTKALATDIIDNCKKFDILPENLAMDTTSAQRMLADIVESDWDPKSKTINPICRIDSAESASNLQVSVEDQKTAKESYQNRVTELWFNIYQYGRFGQIRGLSDSDTCKQLTTRQLLGKKLSVIWIESKKSMKMRTGGRSPDEADAAACITALAREKFDIQPGGEGGAGLSVQQDQKYRDYDLDAHEENYLHSGLEDS